MTGQESFVKTHKIFLGGNSGLMPVLIGCILGVMKPREFLTFSSRTTCISLFQSLRGQIQSLQLLLGSYREFSLYLKPISFLSHLVALLPSSGAQTQATSPRSPPRLPLGRGGRGCPSRLEPGTPTCLGGEKPPLPLDPRPLGTWSCSRVTVGERGGPVSAQRLRHSAVWTP